MSGNSGVVEEDEAFTTSRAYDSWVSSVFVDVLANGVPYVFEHHHGSDPAVGGTTFLTSQSGVLTKCMTSAGEAQSKASRSGAPCS